MQNDIVTERRNRKASISGGTARVLHPGRVLEEDFLSPLGITRYRLAKETFMDLTRVSQIIGGRRSITPDAALRLACYFGTTPEFWMDLQRRHDLELKRREMADVMELIGRYRAG